MPAGVAYGAVACRLGDRATTACNERLRPFDGVDVFALSPREVLGLSRALDDTGVALRVRLPSWTWPGTRTLRLQLENAAHLGRLYSRAYRHDPTDNSLPQEAAFENALLDLGRVAKRAELPACTVRLAPQ
ncbi:MAG: hypothetical protein ACJ76Z_11055 [Thermoleophilaceae bacterium]